jgi:signal transduction histidine kinase
LKLNLALNLPAVIADATQLRQVVMNLILNASEAIGQKEGAIGLSTNTAALSSRDLIETWSAPDLQPGPYVSIDVTDTGCGMDEKTKARIFDPFFSTKFAGRGLGLAAVMGIVRGHKGAIRVISTPGKGTTFTVLLPVGSAAPTEASKAPA